MNKVLPKINFDLIFFYTLAVFILTLPYNISRWWIGTFSIILFLITITNPLRIKEVTTIFHERSLQILFIFIFFTYISVLWSESPTLFNGDFHTNIDRFKYYFLLIPAIYLSNLSKQDIKFILIIVSIAPALSIILYYTNHLKITNIIVTQVNVGNTILRPDLIQNFFILFAILLLYINIFSAFEDRKYKKLFLYSLLFIISCLSLVIDSRTDSRSIDLALLLILISVPYYYFRTKLYLIFLFIILTASALIIANSSTFQNGMKEFSMTIESDSYQGSWGHRTAYILTGIEIFMENPVIGRGINDVTNAIELSKIKHPNYFASAPHRHFHNEHINIAVAVGIIGYMLLIYFFLHILFLNIKNKFIYVFKNVTIIIMFFLMMGEHYLSFKSTTNYFSILVALFVTYKNLETQHSFSFAKK